MNRRLFLNKIIGFGSVLALTESKANTNKSVLWPTKASLGSIERQTKEFIYFLKKNFIINCRPGVFILKNPIDIDVDVVDIQGSPEGKTELHFMNRYKGGLLLHGARHVNVSDIHLYWKPVDEKARHHWGAGLMLIKSENTNIFRSSVHGAPGAGFHFNQCNNVNVTELFVENTLADGVHFQNTSNIFGDKLRTKNTGDDGVAIVDYQNLNKSSGFNLQNIVVEGSRTRGIGLIGARYGTLKDFVIKQTASKGLIIEQDKHYKTRHSEHIQIIGGVISGVGLYKARPGRVSSTKFGVSILRSNNLFIKDVEVMDSIRFGCFIKDSQKIELENCIFRNSRESPVYIINSFNIKLNNIDLTGKYTPLFQMIGVTNLDANNITMRDESNRKKVIVLFMRHSKNYFLKKIVMNNLLLKSNDNALDKLFVIHADGIEDASISYTSQYQVQVLGNKKRVKLTRN